MIAIDRFVVGMRDVSKPCVAGIVEKERHRLGERRMVLLEGQDIIRPLLRDGLGDLFLTPHRINRHDGPCEVTQLEERGDGSNFIGLLLDFELS